MTVQIKRVYDSPDDSDSFRVLVDRVWPRGVSKEKAQVDLWLKDVAPSTDLRKWFDHVPARWDEFKARYFKELDTNADVLQPIRDAMSRGAVTLVYSARDTHHNQAAALREYLLQRSD